ncbi:hypothetical protein M0R72_18005 [Candidatus Pacearchaeota archaeon]|jgi:hypothetical protein|nr:hypothetical protein [Candidatus Pacearchaeota archaeon]
MLNLVMSVYNDGEMLKKAVGSVLGHVDRIIVIDGIYEDFPPMGDTLGYSCDGTLEYLTDLETEVSLSVVPGLTEVEKRSLYLIGEPGDWYLHLDADEWVENPQELGILPKADIGLCHMSWENQSHWYPRLFRHVDCMSYEGLHHRLIDGEGDLICDIYGIGPGYTAERTSLRIRHDRERRSKERQKAKAAYYERLCAQEKHVKEMLRYG